MQCLRSEIIPTDGITLGLSHYSLPLGGGYYMRDNITVAPYDMTLTFDLMTHMLRTHTCLYDCYMVVSSRHQSIYETIIGVR